MSEVIKLSLTLEKAWYDRAMALEEHFREDFSESGIKAPKRMAQTILRSCINRGVVELEKDFKVKR